MDGWQLVLPQAAQIFFIDPLFSKKSPEDKIELRVPIIAFASVTKSLKEMEATFAELESSDVFQAFNTREKVQYRAMAQPSTRFDPRS